MDTMPMISVGFSASKGIGEAIRKFSGGDINHAFIEYMDPVLGLRVTFGANANGFTMVPVRDFPSTIIRTYTPEQLPLVVGFRKNLDWINRPYDYGGLLGMGIVEVEAHLLRIQAKNPFLDKHKMFCSEICTKMLRDSGYTILPDKRPGDVDPWMLDRAMYARPDLYQRRELIDD